MNDLVLQIERGGVLLEFWGQTEKSVFMPSDDSLGKNIYEIMPAEIAQPIMACVEKALQSNDPQSFEYQCWTSGCHYEVRFVVCGKDKVTVIISYISEHKETEDKLKYHDSLTDLPSRYMFNDRLGQAIARAEREKQMLAILFLDIDNFDNFKHINDMMVHKMGDQLLQKIARRVMIGMRKTDSIFRFSTEAAGHLMARLGEDEFTILLTDIKNVQDPAIAAQRIINLLSEPFVAGSQEVFVTASVGIALYPSDGKDIDTLLGNADMAMCQAKSRGKNNYQYYSESLNNLAVKRLAIENKLQKALDLNEFMLFYQPQIDISTGRMIGAEALIRWMQPDLVLVKAGEFIPLAENTGLILPIGEWVLRTACSEGKGWQKAGLKPIGVTVNVSSIQFTQENFVEKVSRILSDTGLDPKYLQLELTESAIMKDIENTINKLHSLRAMGIQIAIDDFGTGYSSLSYLKRFPVSTLKIDYSFVRNLVTNPSDQAIVNAIVNLAHNFNLEVIAEGVENKKQLELLHKCGCEGAQGFLICPPVNRVILTEFIKKDKW